MSSQIDRRLTFVVLEDHALVREGLERGLVDRFPQLNFA